MKILRTLFQRSVTATAALTVALLLVAAISPLCAQQMSAQQAADVIFHNGKVLTVDKDFSIAEAVAVSGNKIAAVGKNQDVLQLAGPNTLKIDLQGRTLVPGLIDTHLHITGPGAYASPVPPEKRRSYNIDWKGVTRKEDVLAQIKGILEKYKPPQGDWLGFSNNLQARTAAWNDPNSFANVEQIKILYRDLTKADLDTVLPNNPAILTMGVPDENALFVNSAALDIILKQHGDLVKKYGRLWLGSNGLPDGHLEPPATRLILNLYAPRMDSEWMVDGIGKQLQELSSQGHTTISTKLRNNTIDAYKKLEQRGQQTVRLAYGPGFDYFGSFNNMAVDLKQFEGLIGSGSEMNWVASFGPSSMDGGGTRACTNQKRSGARLEAIDDYFPMGQCHTDDEYRGGPRSQSITGNYFKDWLITMGRYNLRLANDHVAGDRTVSNLLGIVEQIQKQYGPNATRNWAFDHCRYVDPKDFQRAAKLGVMFSCAPKYILDSSSVETSFNATVANNFIVPVGSMIKSGVLVAYEADRGTWVWEDLEIYMTRKDLKGKVWGPQERLDKITALKLATINAAKYVLKPDQLGSLEPGKLADLAVLDKDYLTIPPDQVSDIQPQLTMMNGKIVFVHTDFANEYSLRPSGAVVSTFKDLKARRSTRPEAIFGEGGG